MWHTISQIVTAYSRSRSPEARPANAFAAAGYLTVKALFGLCSVFSAVIFQTVVVHVFASAVLMVDLQLSASSFSTSSNCNVPGLEEVLELLGLQAYASSIFTWCDDMGACDMHEVAENIQELCDAVGLRVLDQGRLLTWAAEYRSVSNLKHARRNPSIASIRDEGAENHQERILPWPTDCFIASNLEHAGYYVTTPPNPRCRSSCGQEDENLPVFSRVRFSSPLVSVVEFSVEENEHLKFQLVIKPSADQCDGDDNIATECDHEDALCKGRSPSLKRQLTTVVDADEKGIPVGSSTSDDSYKQGCHVSGPYGVVSDEMEHELDPDADGISSSLMSDAMSQSNQLFVKKW